ncbi:MAG: hypothetical protein AAF333_03800 [Planctomycetota bacterium]
MFRKSFHRVMLTHEAMALIERERGHDGPLIVAGSHASWWDPLFALRLAEAFMPERTLCAPIEMEQYERFGVLRKLGLFGLDQHHADALPRMIDHVEQRVVAEPNLLFCITPQGEFSDVRRPIRIRPGVAAVAAALPGARVLALCGEYAFWQDRRPEVFWHARPCEAEGEPTTARWHRVIRDTMRRVAAELAECVIARDELAFVGLPDEKRAGGAAVHPFYDLWLRLRGVGTRIESSADAVKRPSAPGDAS